MTENELRKILSNNVREYRTRLKLSQIELSKKSGVSINFISEIEYGKKWASPATMLKLAQALKIETYELLKPFDSFPEDFDSIVRKYTDIIHTAIDETRIDFMLKKEDPRI